MIEKGRLLPGKVLLKPIQEKSETVGGIIIPKEVLKPKTQAGTVVITGDPLNTMPMVVSAGDNVLYPPHGFVTVDLREDGEYRLIDQKDILFIWRE